MTALKPLEGYESVVGVASVRYPLNAVCGHPECTLPTESAHHIFNRKLIGNDSWFVQISYGFEVQEYKTLDIIPHVIGLCGSGTTGHHGDAEEHYAWIKLEDGLFVWYDRTDDDEWEFIGPLNPQPGQGGKPKRKKRASTKEERRARVNHTIKTPVGEENVLPELIEVGRALWAEELGWSENVPDYFVVTAAFAKALQ